tara:strand:+ start:35 stop:898 length:864 start_codon:yes stop_codon:yes gene_type:complete
MTKARDLANVISGSGTLNANVIPALPASKITSGTFADARLSSSSVTQHVDLTALSADNLTSGTVPSARLSLSASDVPDLSTSKITSGTFADARLSASSVTQHVDLSNLNASNLTSGSIPNARVPSGAVTQHVSAVTNTTGTWTPSFNSGSISITHSARYQRIGNLVKCFMYIRSTSLVNYSSNSVMVMSGLPITSRNTGNSYHLVGVGSFQGRGGNGRFIHAVVRSNSTQVRFIKSGQDILRMSDTGTYSTDMALNSINHFGTIRNFHSAFDNNNYSHMIMELTYLV